jgi:hypothetical protein
MDTPPDADDRPTADDLVLDGNAAAGLLESLLGPEATSSASICAHCGTQQEMGRLMAWSRGPGLVLRCSICLGVQVRAVRTPRGLQVDVRGIARLRIPGPGA